MENPILDKIRKLLRLANCKGATPEEAATALRKAMEMAASNGISLDQVETVERAAAAGMTHTTEKSQCGIAQQLASAIVKRHFNVDTLFKIGRGRGVIHFIGLEEHCHLACYCYTFLVRQMNAAWRKRANRRLRDRKSFLRGYATAIDQLMPEVFHQPGLVLNTSAYIAAVLNPSGAKIREVSRGDERVSEAAAAAGWQAGKRGGIHNAIRGTDKPLIA